LSLADALGSDIEAGGGGGTWAESFPFGFAAGDLAVVAVEAFDEAFARLGLFGVEAGPTLDTLLVGRLVATGLLEAG